MATEGVVNAVQELIEELQNLFANNKQLFFNTSLSDPVIAWFQRLKEAEDFSSRNNMSGYMFTQMLLVTLNMSRRYIYDWFHEACVTEGQSWACDKLLSIVLNLNLIDTGLEAFKERFADCKTLYEGRDQPSAEETKTTVAEICLDVWRDFHQAINAKVIRLGDYFAQMMGTTWPNKRAELMRKSTTFSGRHLQDILAVTEDNAKETFLFVNDIAVAMRSTTSNLMLEQAEQSQNMLSLSANVKLATTNISTIQTRCVALEEALQNLMIATTERLNSLQAQQERTRTEWQQQSGQLARDTRQQLDQVIQQFKDSTARTIEEFTTTVHLKLDEVQTAFKREMAAIRAEQGRLGAGLDRQSFEQTRLFTTVSNLAVVQQVRALEQARNISSPTVDVVSRSEFQNMMRRYDQLIETLQQNGETQRMAIVRLDRRAFVLHLLMGATIALVMFGVILLSPDYPDPDRLT